ncbi:MAG: DUF4142 domain-containing protein [Gemmatimonadaceae bacterium]
MHRYFGAGKCGILILLVVTGAACSGRNGGANDSATAVNGASGAQGAIGATTGASAAPATATPNADFSTMTDPNIASTIGVINSGEIEAAQLATRKASSAKIKQFARDMIADHTKMQKSVDSLTAAKNLVPQSAPMGQTIQNDMKAMRERLSQLSGATFDTAYVNGQVADHQHALDALNGMAAKAQDTDVRSAIQGAIPKVQAHLDRARSLAAGSGGMPPGAAGSTGARESSAGRDTAMRDTTHRDTTRRDTTSHR